MAQALQDVRPEGRPDAIPVPFPWLGRSLVLLFTIVPFAAFVTSIVVFWQRGISWTDVWIMLGFYFVTGIGITVGFHRHFAHQAFQAKRWVRIAFAITGSMAIEGALITWVADHRRHHQFSDKEGDPHSPWLAEEEGLRGIVTGLWHAHLGWLFDAEQTDAPRYAPDLLNDSAMVRIHKMFPFFVTATLVLPALLGFALTGTLGGAFTAFLWGGLVRVFVLHHVTYSINSICHYFGRTPFESKDESRNNWVLSVISFGESWHNNHHAFPSSAVHGLLPGQVDLGAIVIRGLERAHLVYGVKRPNATFMEKKRRA
jgi:stearoyl-CoA desaturase (Delta-9 desaturase)